MLARTLCAIVLALVIAGTAPALAQERRPRAAPSASPSASPTPAPGGERRPAPGFVLLLVVLLLGLVWQAQRVRRSTADASRKALSDFERRVNPHDDVPPDSPV